MILCETFHDESFENDLLWCINIIEVFQDPSKQDLLAYCRTYGPTLYKEGFCDSDALRIEMDGDDEEFVEEDWTVKFSSEEYLEFNLINKFQGRISNDKFQEGTNSCRLGSYKCSGLFKDWVLFQGNLCYSFSGG